MLILRDGIMLMMEPRRHQTHLTRVAKAHRSL